MLPFFFGLDREPGAPTLHHETSENTLLPHGVTWSSPHESQGVRVSVEYAKQRDRDVHTCLVGDGH